METTTVPAILPALPATTPISLPLGPHGRAKGRKSRPSPRSYKIGAEGGRTSLRLETEFQAALREMCRVEGITMSRFLSELRQGLSDDANFSSKVRCAVLSWFTQRVVLPQGRPERKR
jgi:predicted DNA-binding ribbon-helix-helix protein